MKCMYCDGTGTSNTCVNGTFKPCSFCDGTGEFNPNEVDRFNAADFIKVMEMVKKPLTNEQWFCGLSTEEKAKWLSKQGKLIYDCVRKGCTPKIMYEEDWEWWLKQPHSEKE